MSAALVDLVSVGAQDAYITGEPQVSFWRQKLQTSHEFLAQARANGLHRYFQWWC